MAYTPYTGTSATPQPRTNPWSQYGIDPLQPQQAGLRGTKDQAMQGLGYAAYSKLGRDLSEQEWAKMAQDLGYNGSDDVDSSLYNKGLSWIDQLSGQGSGGTTANGTYAPTPGNPTGGYAPGVSPMQQSPWGVQTPAAYTPQQRLNAALPPYMRIPNPAFDQFSAPDTAAVDQSMNALVQRLLANPETLDENTVNAMKTRSKEGALSKAEQLRNAAAQQRAASGFSELGGVAAAQNAAVDNQLIEDLISGNRELDIAARSQNRQDVLNALTAANSALSGQTGRAGENFRNRLLGQQTQADSDFRLSGMDEDARRFGGEFDLRNWLANEDAQRAGAASRLQTADFEANQNRDNRNFNLQEWLAREGVNLDARRLAEQAAQFKAATGLDLMRLLESQRQFNTSFGENQRQFNNNLGFNYTNLGMQGQNDMLRTLLSSMGI